MKTVVAITGASSGIGETFARKLAPENDLILIARRQEQLEKLAAEFASQYGTKSEVLKADLTDPHDLDIVAARLASEPNLGLLVNNAGFGTIGRFWESPLETQENMHKLHVMAPIRLTHAALRNMVARNFGAVINVASVAAFGRSAGSASYSATKSWMTSFTEALYLELQSIGSNVQVQALCPGFTYSEFHDRVGVTRNRLAPPSLWLSAEEVVNASLDGLRTRKLFVIPGWRYRLITTFLTKIPTRLRLLVESTSAGRRQQYLDNSKKYI